MSIGDSLALWDLGVVDVKYGVFPLDAVPYTLHQTSHVIGESRGPGAFIGSAYKLCVSLGFSCGRVKYPLEVYSTIPYGIHCMVGLCT